MNLFTKLISTLAFFVLPVAAASQEESSDTVPVQVRAIGEGGFLGVLSHRIQFGQSGTQVDYRDDAGQDVLFPVTRASAEIQWGRGHRVTLLYQPLELETQEVLKSATTIDGVLFASGEIVKFRYGFPFYRASYEYPLASNQRRWLLVGGGIQIRNATIEFSTTDGQLVSKRNVGPVPLLKVRAGTRLGAGWWAELEADGMYAPVSYLNGDDNQVVGAIVDASARVGRRLTERTNGFANVRYLGGGASGTSDDQPLPGDGYSDNWLQFTTVSIGLSYTWP